MNEELKNRIQVTLLELSRIKGIKEEKERRIVELKTQKSISNTLLQDLVACHEVLEVAIAGSRQELQEKINDLVTMALQTIFQDDTIKFMVNFVSRRGQSEVEFGILINGESMKGDLKDTYGGGMLDIVATTLKLALTLAFEKLEGRFGPICFDEVGKFISKDYVLAFAKFVRTFAERNKKQIIYITHNRDIAAMGHKHLSVSLIDNVSVVKEV